jgi:hypothetical protein
MNRQKRKMINDNLAADSHNLKSFRPGHNLLSGDVDTGYLADGAGDGAVDNTDENA